MTKYAHVHAAIQDLVEALPEEKIAFVRTDQWIPYGAATYILDDLNALCSHPRNIRMPCRIVIGEADNGKTTLLRQCVETHPPVQDTVTDSVSIPAFMFQMPPEPDERRLYSAILTALHIVHREDAAPERLRSKVVERIPSLGVRVLLADELHNLLNGTPRDQRLFLAALKNLLNDLKVAFVAAGTPASLQALAFDPQFATRFSKHTLPPWSVNQELRVFLATLASYLPLSEPSDLAGKELAIPIFNACKASIGGIRCVVSDAAVAAIDKKENRILLPRLAEVIAERAKRALAA